MNYKPPYTINSKMVNLISDISEELTNLKFTSSQKTTLKSNQKSNQKSDQKILNLMKENKKSRKSKVRTLGSEGIQ